MAPGPDLDGVSWTHLETIFMNNSSLDREFFNSGIVENYNQWVQNANFYFADLLHPVNNNSRVRLLKFDG